MLFDAANVSSSGTFPVMPEAGSSFGESGSAGIRA